MPSKKQKSNDDVGIEIQSTPKGAKESVSGVAIDFSDISNFVELNEYLKNFDSNESQVNPFYVQNFLTAALKKNPKFFTHAYHYLTEKKGLTISAFDLPAFSWMPESENHEKTLERAVEFYRVKQEIIARGKNDNTRPGQLDTLRLEIDQQFNRYKKEWKDFDSKKIELYQTEALAGLKRIEVSPKIGFGDVKVKAPKTYYLDVNPDSIKIKTPHALCEALKQYRDQIDSEKPKGLFSTPYLNGTYSPDTGTKSYYKVVVDSEIENLDELKPEQIRSWEIENQKESYVAEEYDNTQGSWKFDGIHTYTESQHINKNSTFNIEQTNQAAINELTDEIFKDIEARIKSLKSSFFYTSAAKAKAAAFEDLLNLIKSKSETQSIGDLIEHWEKGGSRSFADKKVLEEMKRETDANGGYMTHKPLLFDKGEEVSVAKLMKQTRSLFGDKQSDETKSMVLIRDIKLAAGKVDELAGNKSTVQENQTPSNKI